MITKSVLSTCIECTRHSSQTRSMSSFKLVVVGGGAGGLAVASRFANKLPPNALAIIEPQETHYYQPLWTLVGAGIKDRNESQRSMASVMPRNANWIKESVKEFRPKENSLITSSGEEIKYEYLVLALGMKVNFDGIPGLTEALKMTSSGVCSNYSFETVNKTWDSLKLLESGNAIFTFPNTAIKCPGAPQKIMYLVEDYLVRNGRRKDVNIIYNTSLPVIFGAPKYAERLLKVVKRKGIQVNYKTNLVSVDAVKKTANFKNLDSTETFDLPFSFLHVTPPHAPYGVLKPFADPSGYVSVNKKTLQQTSYKNVFGIGDCVNTPTSKTAAAVAAQSGIVVENLNSVMKGKEPKEEYDGYSSCPLVTSYSTAILAEFDYDLKPKETFFFDGGKERRSSFYLKKEIIPRIYWKMLEGKWSGPGKYRWLTNPFGTA